MRQLLLTTLWLSATLLAGAGFPVFGPSTYTRTTSGSNVFTAQFTVADPALPHKLRIRNTRVSSGSVVINGVAVVGEQDFNVNVDVIERELRLPAQNSMTVTISSSPGSYIELAVLAPYEGRQAVDASGGTLRITNPESPIAGTQLTIPTGAVDGDVNLAVTVNYSDAPPAPVPPAATVVSKTIDFTATSDRKFNTPVAVTIPYQASALGAGDTPLVFYYDEAAGRYRPVMVTGVDRANGLVTFETAHFSKYVAAAVKNIEQTAATTSFSTGFVPGVDSYRQPDIFGGPSNPSIANVLYQLWYFTDKKAQTGVALAGKYAEGQAPDQAMTANELTQRLFTALAGTWQRVLAAPTADPARVAADLWTGLAVTGQPQLVMWRRGVLGRAALVYGWDATTQQFLTEEPAAGGLPGAARYGRLQWDPTVRRLTRYQVAGGTWIDLTDVAAPGFGTFASGSDIEPFWAAAENKFLPTAYGTVNVTAPILNATSNTYGFMSFSNQEQLVVSGTVTPGGSIPAPTHIVPYVRGVRQQPVQLSPGGSFAIPLNVNNVTSSWVALVATSKPNDEWALDATLRNFSVNPLNCRFPAVSEVRPNPLPAPNGPFQYISGLRVSGQNLQGASIFTNGPFVLPSQTLTVTPDGTVAEIQYQIGGVASQNFLYTVRNGCGLAVQVPGSIQTLSCAAPQITGVTPNPLPAPAVAGEFNTGRFRVTGTNLQGAQIFTNGPLLLTGDTVVSSDGTVAERSYVIGCCGPVDGQTFEVFVSKACGSTGVTVSISKP